VDRYLKVDCSLGPVAAIYEECSFLCRSFTETQLSHPSREANMAAHELVRHSAESIDWLEDPPDFILSVLAEDVSIM
jgi:hypothetical protein